MSMSQPREGWYLLPPLCVYHAPFCTLLQLQRIFHESGIRDQRDFMCKGTTVDEFGTGLLKKW